MSKKVKLSDIRVTSFLTTHQDSLSVKGGVLSAHCDPDYTGDNTLCTDFMCFTLNPLCI